MYKIVNKQMIAVLVGITLILGFVPMLFALDLFNPPIEKPYFLKYEAVYRTAIGDSTTVNLFFIADQSSKFIKEDMTSIEGVYMDGVNELEVSKWTLNTGTKYKRANLYNLVLEIKSKDIGQGEYNKLIIVSKNGKKSYDVGKWFYEIGEKDNSELLKLLSNTGTSSGLNCEVNLRNDSKQNIEFDKRELGADHFISNILVRKEKINISTEKIVLKPNERLDVLYKLKANSNYDLLLFVPQISYSINSQVVKNLSGVMILNLDLKDVKMEGIYQKFVMINQN